MKKNPKTNNVKKEILNIFTIKNNVIKVINLIYLKKNKNKSKNFQ